MRRILSNSIWAELEPRVRAAKKSPVGRKPLLVEREFIEALLYLTRTGLPWRDLPEEFGNWNAVYQRFKRWKLSGVFDRLFAGLPADSPVGDVRRLYVDSTTVRAHPHAAGAKKKIAKRKRLSAEAGAGSQPKST
jgi:transposase